MPAVVSREKSAPGAGAFNAKGAPVPRNGSAPPGAKDKPEADILFQNYFKSVGPRTYAAQVKRAGNGNHFLVLTEGKRDEKTGDVRKTRLFVFSEDFVAFFRMLHETARYIRENPVPDEIRQKRQNFWARQNENGKRAPDRGKNAGLSPAPPSRAVPGAQNQGPSPQRPPRAPRKG